MCPLPDTGLPPSFSCGSPNLTDSDVVSGDDQVGGNDWGGVYGMYGSVYGGGGHVSDGGSGRLVLLGLDLGGQGHVGDGVVSALCVALAAQGRERCRLRHLCLARCGLGGEGRGCARSAGCVGWVVRVDGLGQPGRGAEAWRAAGAPRAGR